MSLGARAPIARKGALLRSAGRQREKTIRSVTLDEVNEIRRKLRAAGRVPAVVYGHGESTRELTVDAHDLWSLRFHSRLLHGIATSSGDTEPPPASDLGPGGA